MGEQAKKTHISAGLLAHVDAGKTTLSEALLYTTGSRRVLGRVDHRDAFLDTHDLERARGITIFSKQAMLTAGQLDITLVDTPGHSDFSAEAERTLPVLDCAILVISGTDGVQAHTATLWRLLRRYRVPVILFVNKMDLPGTDREALMRQLKQKLSDRCVDFSADGEESERFYFGISNLMDKRDYSMVVCDWRTPVASLFYENGIGRTTYQSPDGPVSDAVTRLRQYEIENGELQMVIDADVKIDDSILLNALGGESSEKMKTIISTIQREQNLVIRDSESDVLLVLGPAGSGKTSIALHRVAYLLYRDRKKLKSKNILVFSPNDIFSNYIAGVIPEEELSADYVLPDPFNPLIVERIKEAIKEVSNSLLK